MTLTLSTETESLIQKQLESGRYRDANDVIRHAILVLSESEDSVETLRNEVMIGVNQLQRGESQLWTPDLKDRLKAIAIENARLGKQIKDAIKP